MDNIVYFDDPEKLLEFLDNAFEKLAQNLPAIIRATLATDSLNPQNDSEVDLIVPALFDANAVTQATLIQWARIAEKSQDPQQTFLNFAEDTDPKLAAYFKEAAATKDGLLLQDANALVFTFDKTIRPAGHLFGFKHSPSWRTAEQALAFYNLEHSVHITPQKDGNLLALLIHVSTENGRPLDFTLPPPETGPNSLGMLN